MPASKITDLLPIPPGIRQPHPYQVLGLADGEQDPVVIEAALKAAIAHLKQAKAKAPARLWNQAARLLRESQEILLNPQNKAELDARFGIVSLEQSAETQPTRNADPVAAAHPSDDPTPVADPLASFLPQADPLTQLLPQADPLVIAPPTAPSPTPDPPAPAIEINAPPPSIAGNGGSIVQPVQRARRKRSLAGPILLGSFAVASFAVIGALVYLLIFGTDQVAITRSDSGISISTQTPPSAAADPISPPRVTPRTATPQAPPDPVMGRLGPGNASARSERSSPSRRLSRDPAREALETQRFGTTGAGAMEPDESEADPTSASEPAMEQNLVPPASPDGEMPAADSGSPTPTEDKLAAAERTLQEVRQRIRRADWKGIKPSAEAALEQPMSKDQRLEAEALLELAELATLYRGGIERAVADLQAGSDFEVTEDFRVIVVETGEDLLVVRFNARNRSFTLDELPWSLAHRLATFAMPDDSLFRAAKAVYQSIAPGTSDSHRAQAIQWLDEIGDEVEGADPKRLSRTIQNLFAES